MVATSPSFGDKTLRVDKTDRSHLRSKLDRLRLPALPSLPWLLLGLVLLGSTAFTYYGYERHRIAVEEAADLRTRLDDLRMRAAVIDERLMQSEAALAKSRSGLVGIGTPARGRSSKGAPAPSTAPCTAAP
jgi:hypothetical protein